MGDRPSDVAVLGGWIQNIVNVFSIWDGASFYCIIKKNLALFTFFPSSKVCAWYVSPTVAGGCTDRLPQWRAL